MNYAGIFDSIPWPEVGLSVIQTAIIFLGLIIGLKIVGRRVFGEMGPQDLLLLLLVAESTDVGLTPEKGGFWATLASATTILMMGAVIERVPWLRKSADDQPVEVARDGQPIRSNMQHQFIDDVDLQVAARRYGMPDISYFDVMYLESDGDITGVLKPEYRQGHLQSESKAA